MLELSHLDSKKVAFFYLLMYSLDNDKKTYKIERATFGFLYSFILI